MIESGIKNYKRKGCVKMSGLIKCDKCKKPTAKSLIIPEVDKYGFKVIRTNICFDCNEKRRQFMLGGKYSWEEEHAENKKELT